MIRYYAACDKCKKEATRENLFCINIFKGNRTFIRMEICEDCGKQIMDEITIVGDQIKTESALDTCDTQSAKELPTASVQ